MSACRKTKPSGVVTNQQSGSFDFFVWSLGRRPLSLVPFCRRIFFFLFWWLLTSHLLLRFPTLFEWDTILVSFPLDSSYSSSILCTIITTMKDCEGSLIIMMIIIIIIWYLCIALGTYWGWISTRPSYISSTTWWWNCYFIKRPIYY
jgi:hypothetical protein